MPFELVIDKDVPTPDPERPTTAARYTRYRSEFVARRARVQKASPFEIADTYSSTRLQHCRLHLELDPHCQFISRMDEDFARDLLLALPPMESREWTVTKGDLNKLSLYSDEASKSRNQKMCAAEGRATSPISASLRIALQDHTNLYIQKGNVNARYSIEEDGKFVTIRTCAEIVSPHNCSSGCWTAEWVLAVNGTDGDLSGKVNLHVYYYEDGSNVQMRSSREFPPESLVGSDDDSLAKAVVDQVSMWEVIVFGELSSLYEEGEMESKLRHIRRILPITKTRFKWDAAAQASVKLLNARSK